jgi:hypothetical protein
MFPSFIAVTQPASRARLQPHECNVLLTSVFQRLPALMKSFWKISKHHAKQHLQVRLLFAMLP